MWLWCRPVGIAPIQPPATVLIQLPAWEPAYAMGATLKRKKKKKKKKARERSPWFPPVPVITWFIVPLGEKGTGSYPSFAAVIAARWGS